MVKRAFVGCVWIRGYIDRDLEISGGAGFAGEFGGLLK